VSRAVLAASGSQAEETLKRFVGVTCGISHIASTTQHRQPNAAAACGQMARSATQGLTCCRPCDPCTASHKREHLFNNISNQGYRRLAPHPQAVRSG